MSTVNAEDMNQTITKKEVKTYSFDDVAKHKTKNDCWMVIHNKVYDCTEFAKTHPGGDIIVLAAGIDATVMFESYHTTDYPYKLLDKYCIGELDKPVPSYYQWGKSDFYPTLKKRVVERLKQLNRPRRGPLELHIKAFIIIFTLMATWVVGFFFAGFGSWELCIAMALLHGVAAAHVGLSIMHDGNHGSFAKSPLANKIAGMGMDLIGSSGITWEYQHVVGHHPFTNLETATDINLEYHRNLQSPPTNPDAKNFVLSQENDPDVFSSFPLVRMHHRDPRSWFHKYQAIYAPLLFSLFTMGKVFISDISFYIAGRVSHVDMSSRLTELSERIRFIGFKLLNFTFMIVIPGYLHGPLFAFGMLFLAHCVCGEYLGLAFIVNHITDLAEFFTGGEDIGLEGADKKDENENKKKVDERDWAYCQAKATANWGVESWFWNAFSGGLNHQLEHHLLPGISHVNYPYIAPVVRETCEEYGVPYIALPSFYSAIKHMLFYLDALGKEDKPKTGLENLEESITDKKEQ